MTLTARLHNQFYSESAPLRSRSLNAVDVLYKLAATRYGRV